MSILDTTIDQHLTPFVKPPITQEQLRRYAEASGDYNPIHLDEQAAQQVGLDGVIAHGMLSMAFLGQFVNLQIAEIPGARIEHLKVRFHNLVRLGDTLTCHGKVRTRTTHEDLSQLIAIECWAQNLDAETLKAFCRESLANYKTPSEIEFVSALPRNAVGKIDKKELRESHVH